MKIELTASITDGVATLINGYVISPVKDASFSVNGVPIYHYTKEEAEAARDELIKKLEACDPKPNLMANPAFIVETLQAENLKLKEFVERAKTVIKDNLHIVKDADFSTDADEQWLSDVEAWEKGSDK